MKLLAYSKPKNLLRNFQQLSQRKNRATLGLGKPPGSPDKGLEKLIIEKNFPNSPFDTTFILVQFKMLNCNFVEILSKKW